MNLISEIHTDYFVNAVVRCCVHNANEQFLFFGGGGGGGVCILKQMWNERTSAQ